MNAEAKRQLIYDLSQFENKVIYVKFVGGREVVGKLVNFDNLQNLILVNPNTKKKWEYGEYLLCLSHSITTISLGIPRKPKMMS